MLKREKIGIIVMVATMLTLVLTLGMAVKTKTEAQAKFYFSRSKIKKCVFELEESNYDWDGKAKFPKVTVTHNGQELVKNVDFTMDYYNNVDAGTACVKVKGIGNYRGTKRLYFYIKGININKECTFKISGKQIYVYYKGTLVDPKNYTVSVSKREALESSTEWLNDKELNRYIIVTTYTVTGRGQYEGVHKEEVIDYETRIEDAKTQSQE